MTEPSATVYVPTLLGGDRLVACLESLSRQTVPVSVVVADNGPGEGSRTLLKTRFPEARRIGFGRNLGFGTALNRAIVAEGTGPIVLLNDDAVAEPDFVEELLGIWQEGHAMVAAVMVSEENPGVIDSAGVIADRDLNAHDYLNGSPVEDLPGSPPPTGPTGGGALYDRDAFRRCEGFDERIFLYYEDLDLALKIRSDGGTCGLAAKARATHGYSETLGAGNPRKYAHTGWSRGYMLGRYRVLRNPGALARVLAVETVVCLGQLFTAKTLAGLTGRISGWVAGRTSASRPLPPDLDDAMSVRETLDLKLRRRK